MIAQVTRLVKVELCTGDKEVVLKNLSKSLDKDSVRVDGIGPASITEVSFQVRILLLVNHYGKARALFFGWLN